MTKLQTLEMAALADRQDGSMSEAGRADLVEALREFKAEHAALVAVAEAAVFAEAMMNSPHPIASGGAEEKRNLAARLKRTLATLAAVRAGSEVGQ